MGGGYENEWVSYLTIGLLTKSAKLAFVILGLVPRICNMLILFNVIRSSAQGRG